MQHTAGFEKSVVLAALIIGAAASSSVLGCAAERPAAERTQTDIEQDTEVVADVTPLVSPPKQDAPEVCASGSKRECFRYWVDPVSQVKQCENTIQYCRLDGRGWHVCGDLAAPTNDAIAAAEKSKTEKEEPSEEDNSPVTGLR